MALAQPREIGVHRVTGGVASDRAVLVVSWKSKSAIMSLVPLAQLLGHVVVPVPHRRRLERSLGNRLGRLLRGGGGGDEGESGEAGEQVRFVHAATLSA